MKNEDVLKLSPLARFMYWIRERHQIYLRRRAGKPKPWTDDEVMRSFFFTNPYRENDKVTQWFRENIREPLRNDPGVIFATIAFRWFNLPSTGEELMDGPIADDDNSEGNLLLNWDADEALRRLSVIRERKEKVFTGAFMINSPGGEPKLEAIVKRISYVWDDYENLVEPFRASLHRGGSNSLTLQEAHEHLTKYKGLGGFMAYEVVCDLRYTVYLERAEDKMTWCNPGPGAVRGLMRVLGRDFPKGNNSTSPPKPKDWNEQTAKLLTETNVMLAKFRLPPFEMRELEHSLCEADKYSRALEGDGKMKRTYKGV